MTIERNQSVTGSVAEGVEHTRLHDYIVLDSAGDAVGTVATVYVDPGSPRVLLVGVSTGWFFGRELLLPAVRARIDHRAREVRLPFPKSRIYGAPDWSEEAPLRVDELETLFAYFGEDAALGRQTPRLRSEVDDAQRMDGASGVLAGDGPDEHAEADRRQRSKEVIRQAAETDQRKP